MSDLEALQVGGLRPSPAPTPLQAKKMKLIMGDLETLQMGGLCPRLF